uniref:Protein kinase domain-containing protein n=1 Tax=Sinocyclocheilus anshuiensis TaxID=1608454 RepID=A0A671ND55_9TELE
QRPLANITAQNEQLTIFGMCWCIYSYVYYLQNEVLLSRLFRHPNLLTSRLVFSSCCQLWVLSPLMSYGSADSLLRSYFPDGMSESLIAYLLYGVLRALEYLHHMGYVHRGVKASHVLLSAEGRVCLSGMQSVYSLMKDGKRMRAVFDMPQHSPSLLPWLSPELLRQVTFTHPRTIKHPKLSHIHATILFFLFFFKEMNTLFSKDTLN